MVVEHQFVVSFLVSDVVLSVNPSVNPQGTCRGEICRCEKDFATEVAKIQKTWNKKFIIKRVTGFDKHIKKVEIDSYSNKGQLPSYLNTAIKTLVHRCNTK